MDRIVHQGRSDYGNYRVVDRIYNNRPSRLLLSGPKDAPQSGIALDDNPELLFDYIQRLFEVAVSLDPRSILIIGGGAFTLPRALLSRLPEAQIDVVELDPELPKLARKYFQLKPNRRLKIHTVDGRSYLDNSHQHYDLIIVDAFSEFVIPRSLLTAEAASQCARLLAPGGTLALNIIAKYRGLQPTLTHRLDASFRPYFTSISLYPADPTDSQDHDQNLIYIASHQAQLDLDYLLSIEVHPSELMTDPSSLQLRDTDID